MKNVFEQALAILTAMGVEASIRADGQMVISGESDHSGKYIVDYYEYNYGELGVDMEIINVLDDLGLGCEWYDPGTLHVFE